jgi:hypothetical protein
MGVRFSDISTKKLKELAKQLHESIYVYDCFGAADIVNYHAVLTELERRGVVAEETPGKLLFRRKEEET